MGLRRLTADASLRVCTTCGDRAAYQVYYQRFDRLGLLDAEEDHGYACTSHAKELIGEPYPADGYDCRGLCSADFCDWPHCKEPKSPRFFTGGKTRVIFHVTEGVGEAPTAAELLTVWREWRAAETMPVPPPVPPSQLGPDRGE